MYSRSPARSSEWWGHRGHAQFSLLGGVDVKISDASDFGAVVDDFPLICSTRAAIG